MFIRIFIKNFRSFNQKIEFNMLAGTYKRHENHVYMFEEQKIMKYSAIYGANAAGKSNFLLALYALQKLVVNGTKSKEALIPFTPFRLDKKSIGLPTEFEIEFLHKNKVYSYSIKYNENLIFEEWLYIRNKDTDELVFTRNTDPESLKSELVFNETFFTGLEEKITLGIYQRELRGNQPFLFEGYNKDLKDIKDAYEWFDKTLCIITPNTGIKGIINGFKDDPISGYKFKKILTNTDIGIDKIEIKEVPFDDFFGKDQESFKKGLEPFLRKSDATEWGHEQGTIYGAYYNEKNVPVVGELKLYHENNEKELVEFSIKDESDGTIRLLGLLPALSSIYEKDYVIFVDEIEQSIHPKLLEAMLKLLIELNKNSKGQLIFSTHQTELLDLNLLRQDEIWLVKKSIEKSTEMYPLSDFKVRFDLDIRNGYLKGMFGSIPSILDNDEN